MLERTMEGPKKTVKKLRLVKRAHEGGVKTGGDTMVPGTSKRACVSNSLQGDGEDSYGAGDHGGEGDSTPPMMGVLGFSKKTTLALLNRMFAEELLSELERRNIEVKLAGGDRPRGRDDLEHVLREVMTREYEEVEGGNVNMDMSNTSSTSQHGRSNTSSSLEHEAGSSEVLSRPRDDQATTHDIQEPSVKGTDMDVSETSSTTSVQVKKEPVEDDFEYCVATSSLSSDSVASTTEPSTSQTQNPAGVKGGSQRRSPRRAQKLAVRIKTEPSVEEETEDEQQDLRSEHCPSSPGQLSQELDQVEVSTEEEDTKPSSAEPVKNKVKTRRRHKYKTWDQDTMEELMKDITKNKLSMFAAAKKYGVPRQTVRSKLTGRTAVDATIGRPRILSQVEEDSILYYMKYRAVRGFPTSRKTVLALALTVHLRYCAENGRAPKIDPQKGFARKWWMGFRKRHSTMIAQIDSLYKVSRKSADKMKHFTDMLTATMAKEDLTGQPHRIYNADEVGFDLDPEMEPLTFAKMNVPGAVIRKGSHDHKLSCLECVAADGAVIPPLITSSKSLPPTDDSSEGPDNALYAATPSGLVEGDVFLRWLQERFLPFCSPVRPVLILMDPGTTHVTPEVIDFASKNDIIFMGLSFRTSLISHPLDVPFDRMKKKFDRLVEPDSVITKASFCKIYAKGRESVLSKAVIKKAFRKAGVYPASVSNAIKRSDDLDEEEEDRYQALLPEEREIMAHAKELEDEEFNCHKGLSHSATPEAFSWTNSDEEETTQPLQDDAEGPSWMPGFFTESNED
ncbi:uncharacterized protein [Branchiostoma lanceolatum]|uniref:uncharacterized protein isoform X2 n=1 Tax=Branchiostoma lanceolatum TaxID=7740 RepID=UPI003454965B